MNPFESILICTDLDGTLLRDDGTVSPENRAAIRRFTAGGGYFTFVTGRMPYYVTDFIAATEPNAPLGCINGGGLFDHRRGEYVFRRELPPAAFDVVDEVARAFPEVGILVQSFFRVFLARKSGGTDAFFQKSHTPCNPLPYRAVTEPVGKVVFADLSSETVSRLAAFLEALPAARDYTLVRSDRTLFELLPQGVNKGALLPQLASYLGVPHTRTVAVGDYNNDIPMLRAAGLGIAVANAVPEAKKAADRITVSNEEHAIARIIDEIERGEIAFA